MTAGQQAAKGVVKAFTKHKHANKVFGKVVKIPNPKTAVVQSTVTYRHPLYQINLRRERTYLAHDETRSCQVGDKVALLPMEVSKAKRHYVAEITRYVTVEQETIL